MDDKIAVKDVPKDLKKLADKVTALHPLARDHCMHACTRTSAAAAAGVPMASP